MPFPYPERPPMRAPNPFLRRRPTEIRRPEEAQAMAARTSALVQRFNPLETAHPSDMQPAMQPNAAPAAAQHAPMPAAYPAAAPAAMPAPPALSPVERFRQLNQTLPDGVQYEPLDKETLRALQEAALPPAIPPPTHPDTPPAAPAALNHSEPIGQFIQDERNAGVFYANLAHSAPRPDMAAHIKNIAESCAERTQTLSDIYKRLHKQDFWAKETEINTALSFTEGINLAMTEENKSILALIRWLDQKPDEETARAVQNIINHKIARYNLLSYTLTMA